MAKKKVGPKITTIEGLAVAMAEGFADVHAGFRGVEGRFDEVSERFDEVDKRLEKLEKRQENMETRLGRIEQHFDAPESLLRQLLDRLIAVESKLFGINRRLDSEAMERVDVQALMLRMDRVEEALFGKKK